MRKFFRILLRILAVVLLLLVAVYLLRGPLLSGWVVALLERELSEELGGTVRIGGIEGNWLDSATLTDVRAEVAGATLSGARVETRHDLLGLEILALEIRDAEIDVDLREAADGTATETAAPAAGGDLFPWPPGLPPVSLEGVVRVHTPRGTVTAEKVEARVEDEMLLAGAVVGGGDLRLTVTPKALHCKLTAVELAPVVRGRLTGVVDYDGTLGGDLVGEALRYDRYRADHLRVEGRWPRLDLLDLQAGGSRVLGSNLVVDLARPYRVATIGSLEVRVPDLRDYVEELDLAISVAGTVASPAARHVVVRAMEVRLEKESWAKLAGEVRLPEDPEAWREIDADLSVEGALVDPRWVLPLRGWVDFRGRLKGRLGEPSASGEVSGANLRVKGHDVENARAKVRLAWPELTVETLEVASAPGSVEADGVVNLKDHVVREGDYRLDIRDLDDFCALFPGLPRVSGRVRGRGTFVRTAEGLHGTGTLEGENLEYEGHRLDRADVVVEAGEDVVRVGKLTARAPWGSVSTAGLWNVAGRTARLESVAGSYDGHPFSQTTPVVVRWSGDGPVTVEGLDAAVLGGRVRGRVLLKKDPVVSLRAEGIELSRLEPALTGFADLTITAEQATWRVDGTVPQLDWRQHSGSVSLLAVQGEGGITLEKLRFDVGDAMEVSGTARLPWRFANGGFHHLDGVEPALKLSAVVRDVARFARFPADDAELSIEGDGVALRVSGRARNLQLGGGVTVPGDTLLALAATEKGVRASVETPKDPRGSISGTITSRKGVRWARPGDWKAAFESASVEGSLHFDLPDLAPLRAFAPEILHLSGRARARLDVRGAWRTPRLTGVAEVSGATCTLKGPLPPMRGGEGRIVFDEHTAKVEDFKVELGYAPVVVSGSLSRPSTLDLDIRGANALFLRDRHLRLRADAHLALRGPLDALRAVGRVRITDAVFSQPVDLHARSTPATDGKIQLFSVEEGPFSTMRFDVAVEADRTFRVSNNVLRGRLSADLRLRGTGRLPEPEGTVSFRDMLVRWEVSSLKVDQGQVRFASERPFSPVLEAFARTSLSGYDLTVTARGELPDVAVIISSTPALTQEEAILLVTTGTTPEALAEFGFSRSAMSRAATVIGRRLVERLSGPTDPDEESFLDRFQFDIGRKVSQSRRETVEAEFRVSDHWYLRMERDRFDEYNGGVVWRLRFR